MEFTIAVLASIGLLSLFNAIVWTHKNFINFTVKVGFISGTLLSMNLILIAGGYAVYDIINIKTFMWFSVIYFGILGFTWNSSGTLNIFMKFIHMYVAFVTCAWLMVN